MSPSDTASIRRVIVEVTPGWRAALNAQGIDWSTATLQQTIEGRWVKVRGWLMFDAEHKAQAENTHPGGAQNWRATAREIHPVTAITILPAPSALRARPQSGGVKGPRPSPLPPPRPP